MGKRGPAPAPTALKLVKGERKDRINRREPKPRAGLPSPPEELDDAVRAIWDYTIGEIEIMRTATPADRDALVAYCEAVVIHRRASAELAEVGLTLEGAKGNTVRNPLVQIQRDAAMTIKAFAAEFGLSPRSRSEFEVPEARDGASSTRDPGRLLSG